MLIFILTLAGGIWPLSDSEARGPQAPPVEKKKTSPQEGHAKEERLESIPDLFDRLSPTVVFVTATSIDSFHLSDRVTHVVGSGLIIDPSGLILTNAHVAYGRQSITVTLDDGTVLPAKLVGADPIFDLAVIQVSPPEGRLPAAAFGDSDRVRVGEEVVAIGNPMGLDQTMTRGIISGINRILPETTYSSQEPLLQTDTAINPGNSGGPLLNRKGEVIGITTAILQEAQNIGFAIPSNLAKRIIPSLVRDGRVIRPWIGFQGQFIEPPLLDLLKIPLVVGVLVEVIEPGSPAEQAGLQGGDLEFSIAERSFLMGGDIITKINGTSMTSEEKFIQALQEIKVGTTLHLNLFREGKQQEVSYLLPERPALSGDLATHRAMTLPSVKKGLPRLPVTRYEK
ncbi:MAG: trypsin-like peptidase domain-containing protein [Nitrospirae bacterium]|nr:trypsin-like peptidase domain-containing protein [Candidatus Manganitrophaceae bacterium]